MYVTVSGFIAIISYLLGSVFQGQTLLHPINNRNKVITCGIIAACAHLLTVYSLIITDAGYDFGFYKVAALFSWSIVVLVLLGSLRRPVESLLLLLFPLAIASILTAMFFSSRYTPHATYSAGVVAHILLAIIAYSIMTIAAFQAILIAFQIRQLKYRHSLKFIERLPPLQTMESLLFEFLWVGLFLLTGVIITGLLFMQDLFDQHLTHKMSLTIVAWGVFATLLWGRHQLGWRGKTAIRWTLTGFAFLALAYFGSKMVLELILNRG